jgi:hypothetical protein
MKDEKPTFTYGEYDKPHPIIKPITQSRIVVVYYYDGSITSEEMERIQQNNPKVCVLFDSVDDSERDRVGKFYVYGLDIEAKSLNR